MLKLNNKIKAFILGNIDKQKMKDLQVRIVVENETIIILSTSKTVDNTICIINDIYDAVANDYSRDGETMEAMSMWDCPF